MRSNTGVVPFLEILVGNGAGSGMAVMFLCTGVCGFAMSILSLHSKKIQELNNC